MEFDPDLDPERCRNFCGF